MLITPSLAFSMTGCDDCVVEGWGVVPLKKIHSEDAVNPFEAVFCCGFSEGFGSFCDVCAGFSG